MTLQLNQIRKYALTAVLIILFALLYAVKKVNAVTQTTLTGSCGILANVNYNGWNNKAANQQPNTLAKSAIGTVNFDTGRWHVEMSMMSDFGGTGAISESKSKLSGTATLTSFDSDTGVYKYVLTLDGSAGTMNFSILPVNSANSYLISGQIEALSIANGPPLSGICQKV
jgi:hypothetical protein